MHAGYWNVELSPLRNTFFAKTIEIRGLVCFGIVLRANEYYAREIQLF